MEAIGLHNLVVDRAFFGSSNTTVSSAPGAWAWNAVVAESGQYRNMIVSNDSVVNWVYGITLRNSMTVSGTMSPQPLISVRNNDLRVTPPPGGARTSNSNIGILLENLTPIYSASQVAWPTPWVEARNNRMADVYNGITCRNFTNQWSAITGNEIGMELAQSGLNQFGILLQSTWFSNVTQDSIYSKGPGNDLARAVAVSGCLRPVINCNTTASIGRGFEFHTTNTFTSWLNNEMSNQFRGLVLSSTAIGQQVGLSGSTQGCNDRWLGAWPGGTWHTWTDNSHPTNSTLNIWFGGGPFYVPSNNGFALGSTAYKQTPAYVGIQAAFGSPLVYTSCGPYWDSGFAARGAAPPSGSGIPDLGMAEAIAQDKLVLGHTDEERKRWISQMQVYTAAATEPALSAASPVLGSFQRLGSASRFAWLLEIQDSLATGNDKAAAALLAAPPRRGGSMAGASKALLRDSLAGDSIVANYVSYYQLYLAWRSGRFNASDSASLAALADLCPHLHGSVIFQARTLLAKISGHYRVYGTDCGTGKATETRRNNERLALSALVQKYQLVPNPNDGRLQLRQANEDREPVRVSVYSAVGALVFQDIRAFDTGVSSLELTTLAPGMYYVNLQDSSGRTYALRFLKQ